MTSPPNTPGSKPLPTDEIAQMGADFAEVDAQIVSDATERVIVEAVVDDDTAGGVVGTPAPGALPGRLARSDTVPSPVPSLLAQSMTSVEELEPPPRDPAAPTVEHAEVTRRVDESDRAVPIECSGGYSVEIVAHRTRSDVHTRRTTQHSIPDIEPRPTARGPVAALVEKARAYIQDGDVGQAVVAASAAIAANGDTPELDMADLTDTARGPLAPIFADGPIGKVPVVSCSELQMDALTLEELDWALLRRVDGRTSLARILGTTKIPAVDALRIAAALFRDGVIRVEDRIHG